jgi:DNA (cytosine-5)-methyltransferase 1
VLLFSCSPGDDARSIRARTLPSATGEIPNRGDREAFPGEAESEIREHELLDEQPFRVASLRADVAEIGALPGSAEVMTAGFPCQNLSMAGDKSGISGAKSGVVEKMFDLIQASRIPTILIENVYFMLQLDRGNGMRWLVERFETLGYNWAYRVLDTAGFGLPQRRRRVYLIASRTIDPRSVLFADEFGSITQEKPTLDKPLGFYWTEGRTGIGLTVDGIPPLKVGSALGIPSAPAVFFLTAKCLCLVFQPVKNFRAFQRVGRMRRR